MQIHSLSSKEAMKAAGIGVVASLLLTAIMVPMMKLGVSPMPKPLGLALWVAVLVIFFPVVGWGFFGLGVSPKLIPVSLMPTFWLPYSCRFYVVWDLRRGFKEKV